MYLLMIDKVNGIISTFKKNALITYSKNILFQIKFKNILFSSVEKTNRMFKNLEWISCLFKDSIIFP